MEQLFNIDFKRFNSLNDKEAADRKKNFELFLKEGLPNKKNENWKFSDLNYIISKNFNSITNNDEYPQVILKFQFLLFLFPRNLNHKISIIHLQE